MNLTYLLSHNLKVRPDAEAIVHNDRSITYRMLGDRVQRLAGGLKSLDLQAGDRVAFLALNSDAYIEYLMAVPWAGMVINPINIRWSPAEIAYSLEDSGTKILMVDSHFSRLVEEILDKTNSVETIVYIDTDGSGVSQEWVSYEGLIADSDAVKDEMRNGDDLAALLYTGGTTGFPKGVMLSHDNIMSSTMGFVVGSEMPHGPRMLHVAPLFHSAGLMAVFGTFLQGGTHVIVPTFDPKSIVAKVVAHEVTDLLLVPAMIQMLLDSKEFSSKAFGLVQRLVYGAAPMPVKLLQRLRSALPHLSLIQGYGMTETAPVICVSPPSNHTEEAISSGKFRSAGLPAPILQLRIVNAAGEEMPVGEVGEIIVKGPNVMKGYWNKPDQTAAALREGWLHTGDGGYQDEDGFVYIVDRMKDMVISGGENIFSVEVENAVIQHPEVEQCAVIGIPSDEWGETVHAVIVPATGKSPTLESIQEFCKQRIAGYKCPRSIELQESLPLSGAGKLLKSELRKPHWEKHDRGVA